MLSIIGWVIAVSLAIPFVGYFTVKISTYAFFRGRQLFYQSEENKKEICDGEKQKA